jgi:propanol-preferring alcohol dehydrogenase
VRTQTETFPLEEANTALDRLRSGKLNGSAVVVINTEH